MASKTMSKIIHGDCLEAMKEIPEKSIDMVITSPPYKTGKDYDETISLNDFISECCRKIKTNGVFAFQVGNRIIDGFVEPIDIETYQTFIDNGFRLVNRIIWTFGHGLHCNKRFSGRYETVCIYSRNKQYTFNLDAIRIPQKYPNKKHYKGKNKGELSCNPLGKNPGDVWEISNVKNNHPEKTMHPCQFPEQLVARIIKAFSNEKDIIFDPFAGSGTTAIACINTNRNYICIEKDAGYFEIARKRIEEALSGK